MRWTVLSSSELTKTFLLYMAVGMAFLPWGVLYALLNLSGWDHWSLVVLLLGAGLLTAHFVWAKLETAKATDNESKGTPKFEATQDRTRSTGKGVEPLAPKEAAIAQTPSHRSKNPSLEPERALETAPKVLLIETDKTMRDDLQGAAARSHPVITWQSVEDCATAHREISARPWDIVFVAVDAPAVAIGALRTIEGVTNYLREQSVGDVVHLLEVIEEQPHAPDVVLVSEDFQLRAAYRQLRAMGCCAMIDKVELSNSLQDTVHQFFDAQLFDAKYQRRYNNSKRRTKDISVLFADMQDFTAWVHTNLEHYERVGYFLDECLTAITRIVHQHDGTVNTFTGDTVMAVFDTPAPQHAEQAVAAALAIREAMQKLGVTVNTGINSGVVFEGLFGLSSFSQSIIVGDVVNVASRLQSRARDGAILIGPDTYEHVKERHFDISPEPCAPEPQAKQEQYVCHVVHGHRSEGSPLRQVGNQ